MHPHRVTVLCRFWSRGIIGLFFFERILHESFFGRIIFRFDNQNCLPRSYDLISLDFFQESFLKSKVYANKSRIIYVLKKKIESCIEIQPHLCKTIMKNFNKKMRMCQQNRRSFTRYSIHNPIFHESIKNLQFFIIILL